MAYNLKKALSAAALVAGLAASPAFAQVLTAPAGGGAGGVIIGGGHHGGFGGGRIATPMAPAAVPRAYVPQVLPGGGGIVAPRVRPPVGGPIVGGPNWAGGGVAIAPRQPRGWSAPGIAHAPHDTAQSMYVGGRHRHRGGHWRGGAAYPYYLGGYDPYPVYVPSPVYETDLDDDEYCVLRKVRVHTRYGWRRVWRRVCT
ncbi:MAG: hypothetical protein H6872_04185 [Methylobacteriaceae bacterium]|nr:hypothetical protein [Methylobacteriaceae bacterium]